MAYEGNVPSDEQLEVARAAERAEREEEAPAEINARQLAEAFRDAIQEEQGVIEFGVVVDRRVEVRAAQATHASTFEDLGIDAGEGLIITMVGGRRFRVLVDELPKE